MLEPFQQDVVLIKVTQDVADSDAGALYEAARRWWRVAEKRRELGNGAPRVALAVRAGRVAGAWLIEGWHQDPESQRWGFDGRSDLTLDGLYLGRDVSGYFPVGAQNPLRYVQATPRGAALDAGVSRSISPTTTQESPTRGSARDLAVAIARCAEIPCAEVDAAHPCHTIVSLQSPPRQVPEAWAGAIETAKVLFLSSNPSISEPEDPAAAGSVEKFPRDDWTDDDIGSFMMGRFDQAFPVPWVKDKHFLREDGTYSKYGVAFWKSIQNRAAEILGPDADAAVDYAMTEVVHCKSKKQIGVAEAVGRCAERWLDPVLTVCPAPVVVVVGSHAGVQARKLLGLPASFGSADDRSIHTIVIGGRSRAVVYVPHPAGFNGPKTLIGIYGQPVVDELAAIAGAAAPTI